MVYAGANEEPVTHASLTGRSVALTLDKLTVFPTVGKSNVKVKARSNTFQIPGIEQAETK